MLKIHIDDFNSHTREGVTYCAGTVSDVYYFNSHTREGVTETEIEDTSEINISTHTPMRV